MLNQLVLGFSRVPCDDAIAYLMTSLPVEVVESSGVLPRLPINVKRA